MRDRVGEPRHLERRLGVGDAEPVASSWREVPRPGDDPHPERLRPRRDLPADLAQPHDAQRAAVEAPRLGVLALVPAPRAEIGDLVGDPPVAGRAAVPAPARRRRSSSCRDSWRRRCRGSRRRPRRWCRCRRRRGSPGVSAVPALSASRADLLAAHDEDLRVDRGSAAAAASSGLDVAAGSTTVAAELLEAVDADLLELVGDRGLCHATVDPVVQTQLCTKARCGAWARTRCSWAA